MLVKSDDPVALPTRRRVRNALPLDHGYRPQLHRFSRYARVVARVDHLRDVLVALRRLLHDQLGRSDANGDTFRFQFFKYLRVVQLVARVVARARAPGAVTRAAE